MRIHDRYFIGLYLRIFCIAAAAFLMLFVLGDLGEKVGEFIDRHAATVNIVRYYAYMLPDILRLTLPVDVLLATMFTLSVRGKNNEIVALLASGIGMLRITTPLLLFGILSVGVSTALSEWVVPRSNSRMLRVKRVEIDKQPALDEPVRHDFTYLGRGYQYFARIFNIEQKRMQGVLLTQYKDGHVVARLDAESAEWKPDGSWEFHDGYYRTFEMGQEHATRFHSKRLPDLEETPEELARLEPQPDAMTFQQLRRYVHNMSQSGGRVDKYLVQLYMKVSNPFTNLVMAVLGIGLAGSKRKMSLSAGLGLTVSIAFLYLTINNLASALGQNETIPPMLAAWIGPAVFAIAGILLLSRADR